MFLRNTQDLRKGLRHFGDVPFKETPAVLLARRKRPGAYVRGELATAFLDGALHLRQKFVVVSHRLLRLAREGHPNAGQVYRDRHRSDGQTALRLLQFVAPPIGEVDRLTDRARLRLVLKRYPVGKAHDVGGLVGGQIAAESQARLDDEWIAPVHGRWSRRRRIKFRARKTPLQALYKERFADRYDRRRGRCHHVHFAERPV